MQNEDLLAMYTKYKYFILPSYYEGNPKVVLEAMASGCIVILSNIDNHKELLDHGVNGYLFNSNEDLIHVLTTIKSSNYQEKIIENSITRIQENNSLEVLLRLNLNDFNSLLGTSY